MKKLLTSLATITLIGGSVTSVAAWTHATKQSPKLTNQKNERIKRLFKQTAAPAPQNVINSVLSYHQVIYVGTQDGLWESFDNGKSFTQMGHSQIKKIYAANNVVYLSQSVKNIYNGLWESTNNGKSFFQNKTIPTNAFITNIYDYNNVVYITTAIYDENLYESNNNGKTFVQNTTFTNQFVSYLYGINHTIYAGLNDSGLYQSTDNGRTFQQNRAIPTNATINAIAAANNVLYVGTNDGLYESLNEGNTFTQMGHGQIEKITASNNVVYLSQFQKHYPMVCMFPLIMGAPFKKQQPSRAMRG